MATITKAERARLAENQRRSRARRKAKAGQPILCDASAEEVAVAAAAVEQMVQESLVKALVPALLQALPPALAASREVRPAPKPDESPPTGSKSLDEGKIIPNLSIHLNESARGLAELLPRLHALANRSAYQDDPDAVEKMAGSTAPSSILNHIDLAQAINHQVGRAHALMDVIERSV